MSVEPVRVAYVLKVYPRFSETFIVSELLAHEAAGLSLEIFSLKAPTDGRFHDSLAAVRAPVTYLPSGHLKAEQLWSQLRRAHELLPVDEHLPELLALDPREAYQAVELALLLRDRGLPHVHAHFASSATTVARVAARLAGADYTFTAHAKDIYHADVDPDDLRRKLADAAGVVTVSDFNRAHLRATYGPAAEGVRRIYNGLDLATFPYRSPHERAPLIAAVGRLVEKKGFDVLVDACALLLDRGVQFRCALVGAGEREAQLRAQVAALRLASHVELTGPRPQREVRAIVQSAAAFAAPCVVGGDGNRDGLPTVLLEAMALGTPAVSTDVTGIPEILRHGQTGLLVPQRDPVALADALQRLLAEPDLRVGLAARARQLIESEFDIHRQAARLRALFSASRRPLEDVA